jgi:hypothetical protein
MKVKHDFITNSSSTNFIIGDKSGELKEILVKINSNPDIIVNIFEVLKFEELREGDQSLSYLIKWQNNCLDQIVNEIFDNHGKIYEFIASDQGSGLLEAGFCIWGIDERNIVKDRDKIVVIKGEGGY